MIRVVFAALMLLSLNSFAKVTSTDLSYTKGDYGNVYHESGERFLLNANLTDSQKAYIGYEHVERNYTSDIGFYRDALLFGNTAVFSESKAYVEFTGAFAGDTFVGAQTAISAVPHSTYFTHWDLALGLHYGHYETGDVQSVQPQIIYFFNDEFGIGHSSWFYEDNGWHHAYRDFVRGRFGSFGGEISVAGGENREDIGFIDPFQSYSLTLSYFHNAANVYANVEDYQGDHRRGSQWGAGLKWLW